MIQVQGSYLFRFSIATQSDFISEANFITFTLVEEAGNFLPTFQLAFYLQNDDILRYLNEGNNLTVSFGRDSSVLVDAKLAITKCVSQRVGEGKRYVSVVGMYSALDYLNNSQFFISDAKSGVEVIRDIVSKYFKPVFNISASNDLQRWISPGISDRRFVEQMWHHSYLPDSFIAVGISSDGQFILKDVKAELKTKYDWNLTKEVRVGGVDLTFNNDAVTESNTGFINSWLGYGKSNTVYDLEAGTQETITSVPEPVVALTKQLARRANVEAKNASSCIQNDNVHSNYWLASLQNLTSLASFSAISVTLSYSGGFFPMRVLDKVMFSDDDIQSRRNASAEFHSGIYFISRISRTLANRQLNTVLLLVRESFNQNVVGG
jgi:hypothetical protein